MAVLLGGDDKGTELAELVASTCDHAVAAVCYGEAGPRFAKAFAGSKGVRVIEAPHMEEAFDEALSLSGDIDVILLSPACASFDEFHSFEERGDVFKKLVASRARARG